MVGGRQARRRSGVGGRGERGVHSLLPLRTRSHHQHQLSPTISCWYCDFKISAFNELLFSFGRKHSRFLRTWFSMGIGFSFAALFGVTLLLLWESASMLYLYKTGKALDVLPNGFLFRFLPNWSSPSVSGFSMSLVDGGYIILSTLISVAVHEFGHAVSAASEGIQVEYIAIFLAVLFPGALVAFEYEFLHNLPQFAALRIYCAGIWHNAVCCAACAVALLLLPLVLYPFYIHGENPMVLDVTSMSPLSGYISPGDVIVSLDELQVRDPQEWMERVALLNEMALQTSYHSNNSRSMQEIARRKGYCIPISLLDKNIELVDDRSICPDELTQFVTVPCFNLSVLDDGNSVDGSIKETRHCLSARDIVHLKKCGNGWPTTGTDRSHCVCSEDESCLVPVLLPGLTWVEIAYSRPYSAECLLLGSNSSEGFVSQDSGATNCGGTFVFIGDALSMATSIRLTAYQPRRPFILGLFLPIMLEKILSCTFHVSLTLALLNSLPVFFLDGESILEVIVDNITLLSPRKREHVLRICLLGGTFLSMVTFLKSVFSMFSVGSSA